MSSCNCCFGEDLPRDEGDYTAKKKLRQIDEDNRKNFGKEERDE